MARVVECEILIAGGSAGGVAAALAAASAGMRIVLLEQTDWLGGQLTSQGVSTPDENAFIELLPGSSSYSRFRARARAHYASTYRLSRAGAEQRYLNVGSCWVSGLSYEPAVGADLLALMLREQGAEESVDIHMGARVSACEMEGDTIRAAHATLQGGEEIVVLPQVVLDATDLGELLPMCGVEGRDWVTGAESRDETGEPDAQPTARPDWIQPFTFPFALEWSPQTADGNVIRPPEEYAELMAQQRYEEILRGSMTGIFTGNAPWWSYRRILAAENFDDPRVRHDVAMINTPGNDYYGGNVIGAGAGEPEQVQATLARARRASLGYLFWLQTECPREDDPSRTGYPELRLRADLFGTPDGLARMPYIRESRRIRAVRTILEQEIVVRDFGGAACRGDNARAAFMPDSVGIGHYALDIHPNGHGEPNYFIATRPFQIPLGALIPIRLKNLLPACKNLGTTHLTNGAYRLHPIEWSIGEAAGRIAAYCVREGILPGEVTAGDVTAGETGPGRVSEHVRAIQRELLKGGAALCWAIDAPQEHPAFVAVQRLALADEGALRDADLLFRPDDPVSQEDWRRWRAVGPPGLPEAFDGSRAEAATALFP